MPSMKFSPSAFGLSPTAWRRGCGQGLQALFQSGALKGAEDVIEEVVLTAPDVDRKELNERFKQEISALSQNMTVYVSSNDQALLMSRIVNQARRSGESTLDISNPDQFETARAFYDFTDDEDAEITLVDVTPVNRTRNFHNFSLETPEFFDDLFLRLSQSTRSGKPARIPRAYP